MSFLGHLLERSTEPAAGVQPRQRSVFEAWPAEAAPAPELPASGELGPAPRAAAPETPPARRPRSMTDRPTREGPEAPDAPPALDASDPHRDAPLRPGPDRSPGDVIAPRPTGRPEADEGAPPSVGPRGGARPREAEAQSSAPGRPVPPREAAPADEAPGTFSRRDGRDGPRPVEVRPVVPHVPAPAPTTPAAREPEGPAPTLGPTEPGRDPAPVATGARPVAGGPTSTDPAGGATPVAPRAPAAEARPPRREESVPAATPGPVRPSAGTPVRVEGIRPRVDPAAAARAATEEPEGPPPIHVSIGRIEVRAVRPEPTPPRSAARPAPMVSLDEYLERGGRPA